MLQCAYLLNCPLGIGQALAIPYSVKVEPAIMVELATKTVIMFIAEVLRQRPTMAAVALAGEFPLERIVLYVVVF